MHVNDYIDVHGPPTAFAADAHIEEHTLVLKGLTYDPSAYRDQPHVMLFCDSVASRDLAASYNGYIAMSHIFEGMGGGPDTDSPYYGSSGRITIVVVQLDRIVHATNSGTVDIIKFIPTEM